MVIPASPANPQIHRDELFAAIDDIGVFAVVALSEMAFAAEGLPQQSSLDDSLSGTVSMIIGPDEDPQQLFTCMLF